MAEPELATQVRLAAFSFLEEACRIHGDTLVHDSLERGFPFRGVDIPLISPRGIHIPKFFREAGLPETPISFNTTPPKKGKPRPYDDGWGETGLLRYYYFQDDPGHRDNVGMRLAMEWKIPLIYLQGVSSGRYKAFWPVYLLRDEPDRRRFFGTTEKQLLGAHGSISEAARLEDLVRSYSTSVVRRRDHQRTFRGRVLLAYDFSCAICRLKHDELLDAAHILPDSNPRGEPWVSNGLTLCKIHHAAFDNDMLGITPKRVVEVRKDILDEEDGPMLLHGLKECNGKELVVVPSSPHWQPSEDCLAERYETFKRRAS